MGIHRPLQSPCCGAGMRASDTTMSKGSVYRRRRCLKCGVRYTTYERFVTNDYETKFMEALRAIELLAREVRMNYLAARKNTKSEESLNEITK